MDGVLQGGTYEIVIGAVLDEDWSAWFGEFEVAAASSTTVLRGTVADQAALHGLLGRIRDLGMPLVAVRRIHTRTDMYSAGTDAAPLPDDGWSQPGRE